MNTLTPAHLLIKSLRIITSISIAALFSRLIFVPESSPLVITPWLFLPVIFIFIFPVLPWQLVLKNVNHIRIFLWLQLVLAFSFLFLISWNSGIRSWWGFPPAAMIFVPALMSLTLTSDTHSSYWRLNKSQWWGLLIWPLMWLALWWAALNGPGANPKEAFWMARLTFASTVAAIVLLILLGAQLDGRHQKETRNLVALQCVLTSAAWVIISNISESWLFANSIHTQPIGYSLWLWLILGIFIVAAFQYRNASTFADIVFGLGAIWMLFSVRQLPAVAPTSLTNLIIVLTLLLGHRQLIFLFMAWAATLLLSWTAPQADYEQVMLNGLSSVAVGLITLWFLRNLPHQDAEISKDTLSNSRPLYGEDARKNLNLPLSQSRLAYATGIGLGFLTSLSGVVLSEQASTAYIQSMILLGILVGLAAYTIIHYWFGRELVESVLREQEERFRGLFHHAPDAYLLFEGTGQRRIVACNKAAEKMLRGTAQQIIGLTYTQLSPIQQPNGELSEGAPQWRIQKDVDKKTNNFEWLHKRLDGNEFWAEVMLTILPESESETLIVSLREISEKKEAERRAADLAKRLENQNNTRVRLLRNTVLRQGLNIDAAFESITEATTQALDLARAGIWFYSSSDNQLYCKDLFDTHTNKHSKGQVLSMDECPTYLESLTDGDRLVITDATSDYLSHKFSEPCLNPLNISARLDASILGNNGLIGVIRCEHTGSPRKWNLDEEKFVGFLSDFVALCLEAHERRIAEREALAYQHELEMIKENLEQQIIERTKIIQSREKELELQNTVLEDRIKQRTAALTKSNEDLALFASVASHDLRAPLRAIKNLSNWIQEALAGADSLTNDIQNDFTLLQNRINRMEDLIVSLLEYSRLDHLSLALENIDLHKLIDDLIDLLQPPEGFTVQKHLEVDRLFAAKAPLQRIFLNLLSNAIKHHEYPEKGLVTISVKVKKDEIIFIFTDNGPGIPENLRNKAMDIFSTLKSKDKNESSGMGLAIVKKLVFSLSGKIELSDNVEAEHGLVVILTFPNHAN